MLVAYVHSSIIHTLRCLPIIVYYNGHYHIYYDRVLRTYAYQSLRGRALMSIEVDNEVSITQLAHEFSGQKMGKEKLEAMLSELEATAKALAPLHDATYRGTLHMEANIPRGVLANILAGKLTKHSRRLGPDRLRRLAEALEQRGQIMRNVATELRRVAKSAIPLGANASPDD